MEKANPPLRKRSVNERRAWWLAASAATPAQARFFNGTDGDLDLADLLVENAMGWMPVPLGIA